MDMSKLAHQELPFRDTAEGEIARMRQGMKALEALRLELEKKATALEIENSGLWKENKRLGNSPAPWRSEHIRLLVDARSLLKQGRPDDARFELERVLDEVDGSWRTL